MDNKELWQLVKKWKDSNEKLVLDNSEKLVLSTGNISMYDFTVALDKNFAIENLTDITNPWRT